VLSEIAILVFSNIDSVVTERGDESCVEAAEALAQLQAADVSVVLCSSRTRAEVEDAQQALGIACPFICESGCAAFIPSGHFPFALPNARSVPGYCAVELGRPHAEIAELLRDTARREQIDIIGFRDMPVEEVARACRLPLLQARLAKLREYSERFRILDSREVTRRHLFAALRRAGLRCLSGDGCHQVGTAVNASAAATTIHDLYRRAFGAVLSVGASEATASFAGPGLMFPNTASGGTTVARWKGSITGAVHSLRRRL
jgi:mannosyl-3-phosphoglycerate phosphatase